MTALIILANFTPVASCSARSNVSLAQPSALASVIWPSLGFLLSLLPLLSVKLKPTTRRAYLKAFDNYLREHPMFPNDFVGLDVSVADFIQECYDMDSRPARRQEMSNVVCATCLLFPNHRKCFCLARRCLRGWRINVPSRSSIMFTKDLMLAFAHPVLQENHFEGDFTLLVLWADYLRVSKTLGLTWERVDLPGDHRIADRNENVAGVNIANTKTGPLQFVPIRFAPAIVLLKALSLQNASGLFFHLSYNSYLILLKSGAHSFGFPDRTIAPHSARIRGALHDYSCSISAETIATTGRWATLSSLQ